MLWSEIINVLNTPAKMIENPRILTCQEVEAYYQLEEFEQEVCWILTGMKSDDYENPLYDILEEDETSDSDVEYAEHRTDYDY